MSSSSSAPRRGRRYWFRLLSVGLIGGCAIAYLAYLFVMVMFITQPARTSICCTTPADEGLAYEEVAFTTDDGLALKGWYVPSRNGAAIVLLHSYGGNRMEMFKRAVLLARHGYGALLYDERASGESGGEMRTFGWLDVNDVPIALRYLQRRDDVDPQRIGILGFSIGGQIALRAASQSDQIGAVVAEEPSFARIDDVPATLGLVDNFFNLSYWIGERLLSVRTGVPIPEGVVDGLKRIAPRPILFIATGRALVEHFYQQASEPKEWWEVPEAGHGGSLRTRPQEYEETVVGFFGRALLEK